MNQENNEAPEKTLSKPQKQPPAAKRKKEKKSAQNVRLPFLIEFTYTVSALILVVLALIIMITSYLAGASLFTLVIRTGVAVTVMGCLLMFISSQISSGLLFSVKVDQEEELRKQEEASRSLNDEEHTSVEA